MELTLEVFKAAVRQAEGRAQSFQRGGRQDIVGIIYESTLNTLGALLLATAGQSDTGWQRAAMLLCDVQRRNALDTLDTLRTGPYQARISTLLDLSDIRALSSLDEINSTIANAISIGAPRYNGGDVRGCCVIYCATVLTLTLAPVPQGFPGHARALAPLRAVLDAYANVGMLDDAGLDAFAWALRRALDAAMQVPATHSTPR